MRKEQQLSRLCLMTTLLVLVHATALRAQERAVATILGSARAAEKTEAAGILSQTVGRQQPARLDSLARGLVEIAVNPRQTGDVIALRAAEVAVRDLAWSALNPAATTPYPGAYDRLVEIFENANDPGTRATAIHSLAKIKRPGHTLTFLRQLAMSSRLDAYLGVDLLIKEMGDEGRTTAERLYRGNLVQQEYARSNLEAYAKHYGWARD